MDQGRRDTNRKLSEIEKRIQKEYAQAQRELTQKMDSHFNAFQVKDEEWRRKLHDGEVTEEQYRKWRTNQMAIGKRWQEMRDTVAEDLVNTTQIAKSIANGYMPEVYALNANYATYEIEKETQMDTSFTLYNAQAVERLIKDDPEVLKPPGKQMEDKIAKGEAVRWEKGQIQSVTIQAILQGESVKNMAKRISRDLCVKDKNAALRYARTAVNGAENAGRLDSFRRAKAMGIDLKKMWVASPDGRTRDWHVDLDGQTVDVEKPFSNELGDIMYPGDSTADPANVWNCRCTMVSQIKGFERNPADLSLRPYHKLGSMSYEEWKEAHRKKKEGEQSHTVINGRDISRTWNRRPDQFDFAIEDIINAQGFDGLPRVVSAEEFDRAVQEANDGNGLIAQRTYSAPNQETLDAYRDQLYNGKWYVDCSIGGAQYGQGMYCAADYAGTLSDGIKTEMDHYIELQDRRMGYRSSQAIIDARYKYADEERDKIYNSINGEKEQAMFRREFLHTGTSEDRSLLKSLSDDEYDKMYDRLAKVKEAGDKAYKNAINLSDEDIAAMFGIKEHTPHYVETLTLDPSAKIISHTELADMRAKEVSDGLARLPELALKGDMESISRINDYAKKINDMDDGSYAAMKGYDAINAEGHGASKSYTVVLNRTKVIFKGE